MPKLLSELLAKISLHPGLSPATQAQIEQSGQIQFSGVSCHTGKVKPGDAFFCVVGERFDGNSFAAEAVRNGAVCLFTERTDLQASVPVIAVANLRETLAIASNLIFDCPSRKLRVIGVTGTNGKTTTTHIVEHVLNQNGYKTGLIGTLGARWPKSDGSIYNEKFGQTTPQAPDFQGMLFRMLENGVTHVVMEVSSHALALGHVNGTQFASACLTNVTQDHLDFHKSMENYWQSKRILFQQLADSSQSNKSAIVNSDDALSSNFLSVVADKSIKKFTYSCVTNCGATLNLLDAEYGFDRSTVRLSGSEGELSLELKISGPFNIYNAMAAILICYGEGLPMPNIVKALETFTGVPGRFEVVRADTNGSGKRNPLCIVDYAHTPDGLANVLRAARALVPPGGSLIVVFGCGGDRDASKRPIMGEIAYKLADRVIVTSDNPRSEDPQKIIADILAGIGRLSDIQVQQDRAQAIKTAVLNAHPVDVIVIAGKGHETYQIVGTNTIEFDDRVHAREAVLARQC